jgi:hypothetical protein
VRMRVVVVSGGASLPTGRLVRDRIPAMHVAVDDKMHMGDVVDGHDGLVGHDNTVCVKRGKG